jgi:competence ComEA-like helix-hairpin-helix protein
MDLESQVTEVDDRVEPSELPVVDVNAAAVEELQALPGIGPSLAQDIVDYREEHGPFQAPEDILVIQGIGSAAYERMADRLTATPLESSPREAEEEAGEETVEMAPTEELPATPEAPIPEAEQTPPQEEEGGSSAFPAPPEAPTLTETLATLEEEAVDEAAPEEEPETPEEETAAEEAQPLPPAEPAAPPSPPEPAPRPRQGLGLSWLWSALLGGLLGMIFALLVFSSINGSLDLNNSRAVLSARNQMDTLAAEIDSLQGEVNGLRQRLDTLEGLSVRMEQTESAVDELRQDTVALDQRADAMEKDLADVSEDLSDIEEQSQQVTTFFSGLQALLQDVFGEEPAVVPTPESPVATPTPTPMP